MNKKVITLGLSLLLLTAAPLSAAGNEAQVSQSQITFNDVSKTHWGFSGIQWGLDNQIVNGYPDGSFKPNQNVTQSEFLAMLLKAYKVELNPPTENEKWDTPFLEYARQNNWTLVDTIKPINRGQVAKLLVNVAGKNFNINDSIHYLLVNGLSNGKTERSIDGYKGDDLLTRAEAIAFIKNVNSNLNKLSTSPNDEDKYSPTYSDPYFPFTWNSKTKDIKALYEKQHYQVAETFQGLSESTPIYIEVNDIQIGNNNADLKIELLDGDINLFDYTFTLENVETAQALLNSIANELNSTYNNGNDLNNFFQLDLVQGRFESSIRKDFRPNEYTIQDIFTDNKITRLALNYLNIRLSATLPDGKNRISLLLYKADRNSSKDIIIKLSYVKDKYNFPSSLF